VTRALRLLLVLLVLPSAVSADPRPRFDYKLFPGVNAAEWRAQGRLPYIPIIRIGLDEGPLLETLVWSGTGAMLGVLAGPGGALVGAAIGSACGYVIGCLYAPKKPQRL